MTQFVTEYGSLKNYKKGHLEIIQDNPKNYAFSNIFEVANNSKPYEKVAVAKNLEYVIEAVRAEGVSDWFAASHDEFAIVMDGEVEIEFVKLDSPAAPTSKEGTVKVGGEPQGKKMGRVILKRGHQAILPVGSAYRFKATVPSVFIQQTIIGDLTVQKWADICIC